MSLLEWCHYNRWISLMVPGRPHHNRSIYAATKVPIDRVVGQQVGNNCKIENKPVCTVWNEREGLKFRVHTTQPLVSDLFEGWLDWVTVKPGLGKKENKTSDARRDSSKCRTASLLFFLMITRKKQFWIGLTKLIRNIKVFQLNSSLQCFVCLFVGGKRTRTQ